MAELRRCPHCNKRVEFVELQGGYAIVCSDHNCLGGMQIHYGLKDDCEIFKQKLISNWNRRTPDVMAVAAAVNCIEEFRDELYESCQEPYDEHGACCIETANEILNRLLCFTSQEAVDAWGKEAIS